MLIHFVSCVLPRVCAPHTRFFLNHILLSSSEIKMCPLRFILVFLSATLAGFFVLRNLRSQPPTSDDDGDAVVVPPNPKTSDSSDPSSNGTSKVRALAESGFWTFVDMASGRYLWRHLVSNPSKRS